MIEGSIDWGNGCIYLEASAGAPVLAALRVEGEELAGEDARQRRLLVGTVVHAGRGLAAANMNRARCGQVETKRIKDKIEHYSLLYRCSTTTHFKKWWNCLTVQCDHLNPLEVWRRSLMMKPSSQRHLRAPGPPRYDGGGEPSCTAPRLKQ